MLTCKNYRDLNVWYNCHTLCVKYWFCACGAGIFPGSSHTSDLEIGTPVATLPGAWRYRVSAGSDGERRDKIDFA